MWTAPSLHERPPESSNDRSSGGGQFGSTQEWFVAVDRAAEAHDYVTGLPTHFAQDMDTYEEEDNCRVVPSIKSMKRLTIRFLTHLAMAFGDGGVWDSATIGLLNENPEGNLAIIRLWRMSASGERSDLLDLLREFAIAFKGIHGSACLKVARHYEDLEEILFRLYKAPGGRYPVAHYVPQGSGQNQRHDREDAWPRRR